MQEWRIIDVKTYDGYNNMAIDEAILNGAIEGKSPPTIRFYQWETPTISLGYFQKLEKEINMEQCKAHKVAVVRRITGGRAILHDHELTYSLIASEKTKQVSGGIVESYLKISQAIAAGLQEMGISVELSASPSREKGSAACFDAPSWHEIVWQGKKLVGSAQTRKHGYLLQHGSIPFHSDVKLLFSLLHIPDHKVKERLAANFSRKAVDLHTISKEITAKSLAIALSDAFERTFRIKGYRGELTDWEWKEAERLRKEKYAANEWNYRK